MYVRMHECTYEYMYVMENGDKNHDISSRYIITYHINTYKVWVPKSYKPWKQNTIRREFNCLWANSWSDMC